MSAVPVVYSERVLEACKRTLAQLNNNVTPSEETDVISFFKTAGSIILYGMISATSPSPAQTAEPDRSVKEGQGVVTTLGSDISAITYWVSQSDGWHVITTVGTAGTGSSDRAIVRFSAVLLPGQSQSISVPVGIGEPQQVLLIRRVADRIEVQTELAVSN